MIAVGLAAFAVASLAEDQHLNNALNAKQHSVAKQQLSDAEEWLRSRPVGTQDSSSQQG